jgi:hypothetical protein
VSQIVIKMKISTLPILGLIAILAVSCKEKGPLIDFGNTKSEDTTYVVTPPAVQPKKVLVEEFTGASCSNCPAARVQLANLAAQNPDKLAIMGIHIYNYVQSAPTKESKHDFRTQDGTDIGNDVYGSVSMMPSAGIDRMLGGNGERLTLKGVWADLISTRLKVEPIVNIDLTSSFDEAGKKATVTVKVTYNKKTTGTQNISLAIIEDGIVDVQDSVQTIIHDYHFEHVLRDYITPISGVPFLQDKPEKEAGRVYQRTFVYDVNKDWKPENCKLIAYVHNNAGNDKEVLQVAEVKLK